MKLRRQIWNESGLLALLFCALLLRTFIPAGFMIGTSASGAVALQLCPQVAPMPMPMHHGSQDQHPAGHKESPCPYGALAAPAVPPTPVLVAAPLPAAPVAPDRAGRAYGSPSLAAPPPPSTGPPTSV